ncbi:MAG: hypothetical protein RI885_2380 [Actinomycetota bacterium]|jgi:endonuclease YncB( thermonuclease family)
MDRRTSSRALAAPLVVTAVIVGALLIAGPFVDSSLGPVAEVADGNAAPVDDAADYPPPRTATVERVVDGDTVVVVLDGESVRVRLLNVDSPESVKPDSPVECLGPEASAALSGLLPVGTTVTLEFDRETTDQYGRMLAAVVTSDGTFVTAALAGAGLAEPVVYGGNDRFLAEVERAADEARSARVGLWGGVCD